MNNQDYDGNMTNNNEDSEPCPDSTGDGFLPQRVCQFNDTQLLAKHQDKYQEWRMEFLGFLEACVNAGAISYWRSFGVFEWNVFHESKYSRICQEYGYSDTDFETVHRYEYSRGKQTNDQQQTS